MMFSPSLHYSNLSEKNFRKRAVFALLLSDICVSIFLVYNLYSVDAYLALIYTVTGLTPQDIAPHTLAETAFIFRGVMWLFILSFHLFHLSIYTFFLLRKDWSNFYLYFACWAGSLFFLGGVSLALWHGRYLNLLFLIVLASYIYTGWGLHIKFLEHRDNE